MLVVCAEARGADTSTARAPESVVRPDDARPQHDDARAATLGIDRYESTHLLLYTDIDPQVAGPLPALMDAAYAALEEYFGPLPPDRAGRPYQMTGYIMADADAFRDAGMLPQKAEALLEHGIHRGAEFWMRAQEYGYYLRHLMIHEGTHCFMSVLPGPRPPAWYMEGMAEFFGAHEIDADGRTAFGVMPRDPAQFVGFGRVEMLREEVAAGRLRTLPNVLALTGNDFLKSRREPYAWSWALCKFLDAHPRSQTRFRELRLRRNDPKFADHVQHTFAPDADSLELEWELFVRHLEYGFDFERAAIEFRESSPLQPGSALRLELKSAAGWQPTGARVEAGATYRIAASGEVSLANVPRPWISQPQGISIRYAGGRPLGRVLAAIDADAAERPPNADRIAAWHEVDIGRSAELTPDVSGTLYLRVNDHWNELADNSGAYAVEIARPNAPAAGTSR